MGDFDNDERDNRRKPHQAKKQGPDPGRVALTDTYGRGDASVRPAVPGKNANTDALEAAGGSPRGKQLPFGLDGVPIWMEFFLEKALELPVREGDQHSAEQRFELVVTGLRGLTDVGRHALLERIEHKRPDDHLAQLIHGKLHHASVARLKRVLHEPAAAVAKAPVQSAAPPKSPLDFGEATREVKKLGRVQAPKGVYLQTQPLPSAPHIADTIVPYNGQVFVTRETLQQGAHERWCYVVATDHGISGFVPEMFIATEPPDATSKLHAVTKNETLGRIARTAYGAHIEGGNDERLYVQGLYEANKDRVGIKLDHVDLSWTKTWHRKEAEEETLKTYRGVKVLDGTSLWIPSNEFIQRLKASGAISSGSSEFSKTYRAARDLIDGTYEAIKYVAGFVVGLLEGAYDAIVDLFKGAAEVIQAVVEVIWNLVTGNPGRIKDMLMGWVEKMKGAWEHRGEIADEFLKKWNADDGWDRGRFQGDVLGWLMMTIFLVLVTMGEDAPAAVAGIATKWPQLIKLLRTVDALGDVTTYLGAAVKTVRKGAKLPGKAIDAVTDKARKGAKAADHVAEDAVQDAGRAGTKAEHAGDAPDQHGPRRQLAEYDPATRTDADLVHDSDVQPRHGESAEEATARSRAAKEEQVRRSKMAACFVAGTLVLTPSGPVAIELLDAGQGVLAKAENGEGAVAEFVVSGRLHGQTRTLYQITVSGGYVLKATRNHPFYVRGRGWQAAHTLGPGDLLGAFNDDGVEVVSVDKIHLDEWQATYNVHVTDARTYFVSPDGERAVWVHNADPNDPKLKESLLWGLGAKGPRQRTGADPHPDFDGASSWATESKEEVERMMGTRVKETAGKATKSNHGAITREQLATKGLVAVETPGQGALATEAGLKHYSIRPATNPDPKVELTPQEMDYVKTQLDSLEPHIQAKPKDLGCG